MNTDHNNMENTAEKIDAYIADEHANPSNEYTYNYNYLPPLAMVETVPPSEAFTARPDWIFLVAMSALKVLLNAVMIGVKNEGGIIDYVEKLVADIKTIAGQLKPDAEAAFAAAIAGELSDSGFPTSIEKLQAFLEGVVKKFALTVTEDTLGDILTIIAQMGTVSGPASSLDDYNNLFQFISLPAISGTFQEDSQFANMRVAGPNPVMIARIHELDPRLPITGQQYQSVMGEGDTLETALADGRLYLADYSVFYDALNGSFPSAQKFSYAPLALFAIPLGEKTLMPVAIQCSPYPNADNPIITPKDDQYNWLIAKTIVNIADGNFHEAVSHLGRTHLFVEPFVIATHNQLPSTHPLFILLTPHFEGTLAINDAAQRLLIAPLGNVDTLMSGSIDQSRVYAVQGAQSYLRNVNTSALPQTLAARGVDDASLLPVYPYRDDALLLWNAINQWVSEYIKYYYASDEAVQNDAELRNWVTELVAHDGGRADNIGEANQISTAAQLIELVTLVIFTASVQHAAVNYPQDAIMSYTPAMPLAGYAAPPSSPSGASEADYMNILPPLEIAEVQLQVGYILGSVYYTRLGEYGSNYFTEPDIQKHLLQFKQDLLDIEAEIIERNKTRIPYDFLLPSRIPQSINI